MKFIKSALAGIALCVVTIASHAGFTSSLSGPSEIRPGYSNSFYLTLHYTPMDLSYRSDDVEGVPGMIEFGYVQVSIYNLDLITFKDGVEYARTTGGLPGATGAVYTRFDLSQPASFTSHFMWTAGDAGNYELDFEMHTFEQTYRGPNALCRSIPECAANGRFFDTDEFYSHTSARLGIDVTPTAPIPEPETFALMLAGLGVISAIARRRKAKQA